MFKKLVLLFISLFLISPIAFADDSSIIPVAWLFTKNNKLDRNDWADWYKIFENTSSISQYNQAGDYIGRFRIFGSGIDQYNQTGDYIGSFRIFGSGIDQYNQTGDYIGSFRIFGSGIDQYNQTGNYTGRFR